MSPSIMYIDDASMNIEQESFHLQKSKSVLHLQRAKKCGFCISLVSFLLNQ